MSPTDLSIRPLSLPRKKSNSVDANEDVFVATQSLVLPTPSKRKSLTPVIRPNAALNEDVNTLSTLSSTTSGFLKRVPIRAKAGTAARVDRPMVAQSLLDLNVFKVQDTAEPIALLIGYKIKDINIYHCFLYIDLLLCTEISQKHNRIHLVTFV